jgi:hypothetical protein
LSKDRKNEDPRCGTGRNCLKNKMAFDKYPESSGSGIRVMAQTKWIN